MEVNPTTQNERSSQAIDIYFEEPLAKIKKFSKYEEGLEDQTLIKFIA